MKWEGNDENTKRSKISDSPQNDDESALCVRNLEYWTRSFRIVSPLGVVANLSEDKLTEILPYCRLLKFSAEAWALNSKILPEARFGTTSAMTRS